MVCHLSQQWPTSYLLPAYLLTLLLLDLILSPSENIPFGSRDLNYGTIHVFTIFFTFV